MSKSCREYIKELKEERDVLKKALELACQYVNFVPTENGIISAGLYGENVQKIKDYFKTKAEEIKSE